MESQTNKQRELLPLVDDEQREIIDNCDTGMWTIDSIRNLGFKLISNKSLWCHFRGHEFDVYINLDTKIVKGNYFTFHSYKNNFKGNFRAVINTEEEFKFLLRIIV